MRVARSILLALGVSLVACGGAEPPPQAPAVTIAATTPAPAAPAAPAAPIVAGLPSNAILTASFDSASIARLLLIKVPGLPVDDLANLFAPIAPSLDPSRPITLAMLGPTPAEQRAIATLRPLVPATEPAGSGTLAPEALHAAVADLPTAPALRVLIPTKDPAALRGALAPLLERAGFKAGDGDWGQGKKRIAISATADTLIVDLAAGKGALAALATLRASSTGDAHTEAPPLEGRYLRVRYKPADLADLGFLTGISMTDGALAGGAIDPVQKARIAAQGAWESAQSYALAGSAKGSYFDAVDISLRGGEKQMELLITADVGPGLVAPPDEAWKPSTSIVLPDNEAVVDIAQAFSTGWGFPDDRGGREGGSKIVNTVREAGFAGYLVGLPWLLAEMPRIQLGQARLLGDRPQGSIAFARTGLFSQEKSRSFFAVLPEKTSRAAAECALAEKAPCSGALKLKLNGVTTLPDHRFARLVQSDSRFVLYMSRDKDALPAKATLREVGPARIELVLRALMKREHLDTTGLPLPDRLIGTVDRTPRSIVFRLATP